MPSYIQLTRNTCLSPSAERDDGLTGQISLLLTGSSYIYTGHMLLEKLDDLSVTRCRVLDLKNMRGKIITGEYLERIDFGIDPGDSLLFYTGLAPNFATPLYREQPVFDLSAGRWLAVKQPAQVGIDCGGLTLDPTPAEIDQILTIHNIPVLKNLVNLDKLFGHRATLFSFPLKISGYRLLPLTALAERAFTRT